MSLEIFDYNLTENVQNFSLGNTRRITSNNSRSYSEVRIWRFLHFYFGKIFFIGQQPKSTYLLLGNVSLADTIVGLSMMCGVSLDPVMTSDPLCIFQIGKYYFQLRVGITYNLYEHTISLVST